MSEHTLPWSVEAAGDDAVNDAQIYGKRGTIDVLIADVMDKDEAAFIVKAVNAHGDLLTALQMTLPALEWCEKQWAKSPQHGEGVNVLAVVRAALASITP